MVGDLKKVIVMAELTIPFDTVLEGARERKEAKYDYLRVTAVRNGYRASLITLEIVFRGVPHMPGLKLFLKNYTFPQVHFKNFSLTL